MRGSKAARPFQGRGRSCYLLPDGETPSLLLYNVMSNHDNVNKP